MHELLQSFAFRSSIYFETADTSGKTRPIFPRTINTDAKSRVNINTTEVNFFFIHSLS